MQPYELINYQIEDLISDNVDENYCLLFFPDNIRFDHSRMSDPHDFIDDKSQHGSRLSPSSKEHERWIERFNNGEDLGTEIFHSNEWINTKYISKIYNVAGVQDLRYRHKYNFYQHSWEPIYFAFDKVLWDYVSSMKNQSVVLHSEKNSKDLLKLQQQNITTLHWFSHAYLCSEFYFKHYQKLNMVTNYIKRPIRHKWMCANRLIDGPRKYRLDFLNCIDTSKGIYSLLDKDPYTSRSLKEIYPNNAVKPNSFDSHKNHSAEIKVDELTPWNTSFLHIVNETVWQEKIHFTEKVFKPIVLHQPFVVLQAPGSLSYLRSYGFKTFGDWWDESYDTIEDSQQRMQAIADIVNAIGEKSLEELETMRMEMASVLEHNFRHFYENIPAICLDELRKGIATL
jgi:hypothetical protein